MGLSRRRFLAGALSTSALARDGLRRHGGEARRPVAAAGHGAGQPRRRLGHHGAAAAAGDPLHRHRPERPGVQRRGRRRDDRARPALPRDRRRAADDDGPRHGRRDRDEQVGRGPRRRDARSPGCSASPRSSSRPASSPYDTLADFVRAWKDDPRGLPVAGGSAGGTDQVLAGLLATAGGRRPQADQLHRLLRRRPVARGAARQPGRGRHLGRGRVRRAGALGRPQGLGRLQRGAVGAGARRARRSRRRASTSSSRTGAG